MMKFGKPLSLMVIGVASAAVLLLGGQYLLALVSPRDSPQSLSAPGRLSTLPVEKSTPSPDGQDRQIPARLNPGAGVAPAPVVSDGTAYPSPVPTVQGPSLPRGAEPTDARIQAMRQALQQTLQRMLDENPEFKQRLIGEATQEPQLAEGVPGSDEARAALVPMMQQALEGMLPQFRGNVELGNALQDAANTSNQKGQ